MRHPCRKAGGKRPVSRPTDEREFKAEFGCDSRRGFTPYNCDPLGFVIKEGTHTIFCMSAKTFY
ncbi:hypothetical protein ACPUYX_00415 [Desulfosporosinus sp. SYSU MS00001]|uniref:hypothetical protein n=1 Tax=Desulfosporosinus sp. SYSU MS00001 TaxID=3416284 RepID=UPI003CEA4A87